MAPEHVTTSAKSQKIVTVVPVKDNVRINEGIAPLGEDAICKPGVTNHETAGNVVGTGIA